MEDTAVAPEFLGIVEEIPLVGGDMDGDSLCRGARVTLTLITVVVGMQNGFYFRDPDLSQQLQNMARTEIDQDGAVCVLQNVNVAGIAQNIKIG
jgi:hypothetical protein